MIFKTRSFKAYLLSCAVLFTFAACGSPDFGSPQNQSVHDAQSGDEHDTDASSTTSDTQSFTDISHDTTPPASAPKVTIKSAPDTFTSTTSATLDFECDQDDCTFACSMNGPFFDCSPPMLYENLSDTQYTFIVRARNSAYITSSDVQHIWTVDTTAPEVANLTGPPVYTNQKNADITFECSETDCTFECALNENDFQPCASPQNYQNLPDGKHSVSVRATDLAANTGPPAVATWTVDTVKPEVTILSGPKSTTHFSSATFTFECNEPGCKFECSIDNQATFHNCTSPKYYEGLERKPQSLIVRATDRAQNVGLSTPYKWTVTWPKWVQVAVADNHACGLIDDGTLWCWGSGGSASVLGHPTITSSDVPIQVESASDWKSISANALASCGIRNNGKLYCWGFIFGGEAPPGSSLKAFEGTNWKSVTVGSGLHNCGIRGNGQLWCWGNNNRGQLGIGTTQNKTEPVHVASSYLWQTVATGLYHTCAVDSSNFALCWGSNSHGQIHAPESTTSINTPTRLNQATIYESVAVGHNHTFITTIYANEKPLAFGNNEHGQLGLGHYTEKVFNGGYANPNALHSITGGTSFSCGMLSKKVYCTGRNDYGQLGRGRISVRENTFQPIHAPNTEFTQIDAGSSRACAVDSNGNIWCWGGSAEKSTPTQIPWPH